MMLKSIKYVLCLALLTCIWLSASAQKVVLIGTNDTHSQIDPTDDDNMGGVLRRKVVIDSIRSANENVILIDLGDPVQGTMYFNLFGGEVENMVMNELGYDIRILGNHDFDNGMEELKKNIENSKSTFISTNYKFEDKELSDIFKPYLIKNIGNKKVAFIGINLEPKGMISEGNYDGVTYLDAFKAANATAWHLKNNENVDEVIALTHIGYYPTGTGTSDRELANISEDIDIIIGGHSHTLINPRDSIKVIDWLVPNADNDNVLITQAGKSGKYIAVVELDLETKDYKYKVIPIDKKYDDRIDKVLDSKIEPYRNEVEKIMNNPVGKSAINFDKESSELLNFIADFIRDRGNQLSPGVDFAIINKGGIRRGLPKGTVTQGQIQSMLPFNNKVVVMDIDGKSLMDNFAIMAMSDGNGLSSEAEVIFDHNDKSIIEAKINGKAIEPEKIYKVATIDYLANGGDYMTPLKNGKWLAQSKDKVYDDLLVMLQEGKYKGKILKAPSVRRMRPDKED